MSISIKNLYEQVLSKEISKENFLYTVRKDPRFSKFINNTMIFEDVVNTFKNKGFIWESSIKDESEENFDFKKSFKNINENNLVNKYKGGKGDKNPIDHVNFYEFTKGWKMELSKVDDLDKAKEIALKNLAKDPMFYTRLEMTDYISDKKKGSESSKEYNKKDAVDKDNGMKPVKGIKKAVKDSTKKIDKKASKKPVGVKQLKGDPGALIVKKLQENYDVAVTDLIDKFVRKNDSYIVNKKYAKDADSDVYMLEIPVKHIKIEKSGDREEVLKKIVNFLGIKFDAFKYDDKEDIPTMSGQFRGTTVIVKNTEQDLGIEKDENPDDNNYGVFVQFIDKPMYKNLHLNENFNKDHNHYIIKKFGDKYKIISSYPEEKFAKDFIHDNPQLGYLYVSKEKANNMVGDPSKITNWSKPIKEEDNKDVDDNESKGTWQGPGEYYINLAVAKSAGAGDGSVFMTKEKEFERREVKQTISNKDSFEKYIGMPNIISVSKEKQSNSDIEGKISDTRDKLDFSKKIFSVEILKGDLKNKDVKRLSQKQIDTYQNKFGKDSIKILNPSKKTIIMPATKSPGKNIEIGTEKDTTSRGVSTYKSVDKTPEYDSKGVKTISTSKQPDIIKNNPWVVFDKKNENIIKFYKSGQKELAKKQVENNQDYVILQSLDGKVKRAKNYNNFVFRKNVSPEKSDKYSSSDNYWTVSEKLNKILYGYKDKEDAEADIDELMEVPEYGDVKVYDSMGLLSRNPRIIKKTDWVNTDGIDESIKDILSTITGGKNKFDVSKYAGKELSFTIKKDGKDVRESGYYLDKVIPAKKKKNQVDLVLKEIDQTTKQSVPGGTITISKADSGMINSIFNDSGNFYKVIDFDKELKEISDSLFPRIEKANTNERLYEVVKTIFVNKLLEFISAPVMSGPVPRLKELEREMRSFTKEELESTDPGIRKRALERLDKMKDLISNIKFNETQLNEKQLSQFKSILSDLSIDESAEELNLNELSSTDLSDLVIKNAEMWGKDSKEIKESIKLLAKHAVNETANRGKIKDALLKIKNLKK